MVIFRKRLGKDIINEINELILKPKTKHKDSDDDNSSGGAGTSGPYTEVPKQEERRALDMTEVGLFYVP